MRILHVCLGCFYIDNYSYQENMLPKYHKKNGHDVQIIASTLSFDENGKSCYVRPRTYNNEDGIKVTRVDYKKGPFKKINILFRKYESFLKVIYEFKPNIIFIHGCQFWDIKIIKKYAKKNIVTIFVDNHADFSNSARNFASRYILHGIIWKSCAKKIEPYTTRFYGVLPARVEFLKKIYKISPEKIELLVMGADDELIDKVKTKKVIEETRKNINVKPDDFVIITGGKIDHEKEQVIILEQVIKKLNDEKVKLIIFGSIVPDMKEEVLSYCDNRIIYIGWQDHESTYKYLASSDLAIYPGRHSVLWEETVGIGIPLIVKRWDGTQHININGNVQFIDDDSIESLYKIVKTSIDSKNYNKLKNKAIKSKKYFSYYKIAKKSIEL